MRKTLMFAALSSVLSSASHAQSSVSLYGLVDAGITYTNNVKGHSLWQETSGAVNSTRWGLRGTEDLGGGLMAIFTLEGGFSTNNGTLSQGGREFGRQAFVGLADSKFGALTLGRQYDSMVDYVEPLALPGQQFGGTFTAHPFDNDNLDNTFRLNNSVKYESPDIAGLKFGGVYAFSNNAGQFANNRAYSAGATYSYGALTVAAAYLQLNNNLSGATPAAALTSVSSTGAVAGDSTLLAGRQQTWGAAVNYGIGPVVAGFVYSQTNLTQGFGVNPTTAGQTISFGGNSVHFQNFELNGHYALTPAVSLAGSYTYTQANFGAGSEPKWGQVNLQAAYYFSKLTTVYLQGEYQHLMNREGLNGQTIGAMINNTASGGASSTGNQVAVTAGLRVRF
ncbi:porin [Paraburkholderia edwinii]|uniref:Porin n=1 Tax=Paraburkholderia edwinii TaxID=2861782 RepID=A0ABX8UX34_9BURK|nr:porin [Paraburkholderia edwinii]QYD71907.1 porin [Paraburkholderia edwinii]